MEKIPENVIKLIIILVVMAVGYVFITGGAEILANLGGHIMNLFRRARIFPPNAEFLQLFFIAIFVGWAISRFKK